MKKSVALLLTFVMMVTGLVGCGGQTSSQAQTDSSGGQTSSQAQTDSSGGQTSSVSGQGEKLKVGFSVVTQEFPFHVKMFDGMQEACEAKGYEFLYANAERSADKQLSDCEDLLAQGVDVLVICTYYGDALMSVFDDCKADNIPVFLISSSGVPSDTSLYVSNIGVDNKTAGYYGGLYAAKYFKEQKDQTDINLALFKTATEVGAARVAGFQEGLAAGGMNVTVLNTYDGSTREEFMASCEDALVTFDHIDLIYGYSAQAGLGCYDAVLAAKRNEVMIIGTDAEDEEIELIDSGTQYIGSVMQFPADMAEFCVQCIADYMAGETLESYYAYDTGVYGVDGIVLAEDLK